ncbi:FkbM family methyltransferase [uncultured Limnobacter sp.]|uniref:FkbM family methyltransferase n=1 Tax=uncultured Limnobacter sp. TaxID=199681 RepID=UPI0030FAF091
MLRRFIRKKLRNLGFQRRVAPDFYDVMQAHHIDVVLDVGANDGDYGREIRDRGYKGLIISFEPNPVVFERLKRKIKNEKNWIAYPYAMGESNCQAELSIAENDAMSSFKELTDFGSATGAKPISIVKVDVLTLDSFLDEHQLRMKNIYLKIDTQGFEMEVLRGASKSLKRISAIQAEVALIHTYTDEFDWLSFIAWLRERRFEVATAVCNSTVGAQVREFDFVFTRRELNKK